MSGRPTGSTPSPAPVTRAWRGSIWLGTSAPSVRPIARSAAVSSGPPAIAFAARRTAAASALPPPSPAATGIRFSIVARNGGRPGTVARSASIATPARLGPLTPAQITSSEGATSTVTSSASSSEANREHSSCSPSARRGPTCRTRFTLAGAVSRTTGSPARQRGQDGRELGELVRGEALGAEVGGVAQALELRAGALADSIGRAGGQRQRPGERLAAVRERGVYDRDDVRSGRRPGAAQHRERRLDVRHGMEDRPRDAPLAPHPAGKLREDGRCAVRLRAGRGGQSLGDLALDHGYEERRPR